MEQTRICRLNELSYEEKQQVNQIINLGFNHPIEQDNLSFMSDYLICIISVEHKIVGISMIEEKTKKVMKPLSREYLFLNTISVHPDYRGRGYCNLIVKGIIKQYGKNKSMYLSVHTTEGKANENAIRCYQKNGFRLVDCLYEERGNDDAYSYMVRLKQTKSKSTQKRKQKKKLTKKRTKKVEQNLEKEESSFF